MRLDSSVVGERAGGAGGGARRPTPVTVGDESGGVRGVENLHPNFFRITETARPHSHIFTRVGFNDLLQQLSQFPTYTCLEVSSLEKTHN